MTRENGAGAAGTPRGDRGAARGRHLRALRAERGWSQETLRQKSGVSQATIRSIENSYPDARQHSPVILISLSRAFGLPGSHLADYPENPQREIPPARPETDFEKEVRERMNAHDMKMDALIDAVIVLLLNARTM